MFKALQEIFLAMFSIIFAIAILFILLPLGIFIVSNVFIVGGLAYLIYSFFHHCKED